MVDPSAEKQRELKCAASLFFFAEILSSSPFPPPRSLLPSIVPTCVPVLVSKVTICPTKVATLTICPSGLQARARPSLPRAIASLVALVPTASQILSDLSQDTVANWVEVGEGENAIPPTGPSCPANTSTSLPVVRLHRYTSNTSNPPAAIKSPLLSTPTQLSCTGRGVVKVLKFLYLVMSKALTVPSNELLITTFPLGVNASPVTADSCSEKVTKQKPVLQFQILILVSSPPVATREPSGLYTRQAMLLP